MRSYNYMFFRNCNGILNISADVDGHYYSMRYIYYSKREAERAFRKHFNLVGKHFIKIER